ncbi:MAG: hypothetical protein ACFBQW_09440 [Sphingomonadaceae bacterium]
MLRSMIQGRGEYFAHNPAGRGYHVVYREDAANHCPGCGRSNWYIGRSMAECAFCATALPLENTKHMGAKVRVEHRRRPAYEEAEAFAA